MTEKGISVRREDGYAAMEYAAQPPMKFTPQEEDLIFRGLDAQERIIARRYIDHFQLDPIRGELHFWVYNKNDPTKRRMIPYASRDGWRKIVSRLGGFKGIVSESFLVKDKEGNTKRVLYEDLNPEKHTIISATTEMLKEGHEVPIKKTAILADYKKIGKGGEVWEQHEPDMILKVAERKCYKHGWQEDAAGLYSEEELHAMTIDAEVVKEEPLKIASEPQQEPAKPKATPKKNSAKLILPATIEKATNHLIKIKRATPEGVKYAFTLACEHFAVEKVEDIARAEENEFKSFIDADETYIALGEKEGMLEPKE